MELIIKLILLFNTTQIEELNQDGIDIQSQKTNEQLDDEEEDRNFAIVDIEMHKWETFEDQHNP